MAHKRKFKTGAVRDSANGKPNTMDYSDPLVEWRFFRYMKKAEAKYGKGNWKKGIPKEEYLQSLFRHAVKEWIAFEYGKKVPKNWGGKLLEWLGPIDDLEIGYDHGSGIRFNANGYMREQIIEELSKYART